ncbi:MAG TPA: alpha/beta hydrolase [Gemmatimonadales bacterium]|nr:alpha/beta hydrolase [Gemmatimonadales bacterium]
MTHPLIELGGQGPLIHLAPANGFPPASYLPALEPLLAGHRVVSLPPRAMWPDAGAPPEQPGSWTTLGDDLLAGFRAHQLPPLIAIGHSFGAVVSLVAAVKDPSRFRALALLDPTILPPPMMDQVREQRLKGEMSFRPLVQGARNRRERFSSPSEAFSYWRGKPLFADWSDDAVQRYARAMLRPTGTGDFTLSWPGAWEAHYYESFYPDSWADVARLDSRLPVLVVGGSESDTLLPEATALLREKIPWATHMTVPGYGHLFPQAAPEQTGRMLRGWIESLSAPSLPPR